MTETLKEYLQEYLEDMCNQWRLYRSACTDEQLFRSFHFGFIQGRITALEDIISYMEKGKDND
jgi:hypothetical protein